MTFFKVEAEWLYLEGFWSFGYFLPLRLLGYISSSAATAFLYPSCVKFRNPHLPLEMAERKPQISSMTTI
jgi:hypothetical protein